MLNRRLMMAEKKSGSSDVYPGYRVVNYIEATGKQYGTYQNNRHQLNYFDATFQRTELSESEGIVINNTKDGRAQFYYALKNVYAGWGTASPVRIFYPTADLKKHFAKITGQRVYLDSSMTSVVSETTSPMSIDFLGTGYAYRSYMKLFSINFKEVGGTEIHLIPAVRESDGKPGLLETKTLMFYPSKTSEDFLYG